MVDHVTFVCEGVWVNSLGKNFLLKSVEVEIFSLTHNSVMSDIFFTAGYDFSQSYPCKLFPLEISLEDIFFLKSPITPSKVKWSAPKIHHTFAQLTDSDLSIISKAF